MEKTDVRSYIDENGIRTVKWMVPTSKESAVELISDLLGEINKTVYDYDLDELEDWNNYVGPTFWHMESQVNYLCEKV